MSSELKRLESIAAVSRYAAGANLATIEYLSRIFGRFIRRGPILEMGPAEGVMSAHLARLDLPLTIVDGSELFCERLRKAHPGAEVVHSLFEDFEPSCRFRTIIMGHVLEHVEDPVAILRRARAWLEPDGRLLAAVPNSRSLHRQAAVIMGMLEFEEQLNDADRYHGHRRVYNPETFRRDFLMAGYSIEVFGGYWLKPLANSQIEAQWTPQMLEAFFALGERYPDIAAEIYIVAKA